MSNPTVPESPDWTREVYFPRGLAFDADGYLWVADEANVLAFSPATLALAGQSSPAPDAGGPLADFTLSAVKPYQGNGQTYGCAQAFRALAFDTQGNLWVTTVCRGGYPDQVAVVEYLATDIAQLKLSAGDEPVGELLIIENAYAYGTFGAIAFDSDGNIWIGAFEATPNLFRFPPEGVLPHGKPDITLTVSIDPSFSLVFDPPSPGLPIRMGPGL
jgi:hypothetical protein